MMQKLKNPPIFPESISQISYANEDSENATIYNMAQQKITQTSRNEDLHIKINNEENHIQKFEKFPCVQLHPSTQEQLPKQQEVQYKEKVTGYEVNKDILNQEEIIKAFKILDVNKDEVITQDDLVFMLDYIQEQYTIDEVEEMINMLSEDKKQVTIEDFKKIGKAEILPLANIKVPTSQIKNKAQILKNIQKTDLIDINPDYVRQKLVEGVILYDKYEQAKKNPHRQFEVQQHYNAELQFQNLVSKLPLKSQKQFIRRKEQFSNINIISIEVAQRNYKQFEDRQINQPQICSLLQISQKQTRTLYPYPNEESMFVMLQAIIYSCLKKISKLQKCLHLLNHKSTVSIRQLLHVLMLVKGKDPKLPTKLNAILKHKKMKFQTEINKIEAIELIRQHLSFL